MFKPQLFESLTLKDYNRKQVGRDLKAGLIVGIVALPLAIAFAKSSGVSPEKDYSPLLLQDSLFRP